MKVFRFTLHAIYTMLLGMIMVSCSDSSDVAEDTSSPALECKILFNVENPAGMRMADAVVQTEGQAFRGLQSLLVIPFKTSSPDVAVVGTDIPYLSPISATSTSRIDNTNYYYIVKCRLMRGVNRMLAYAKATDYSTDKSVNGSLVTNLSERMYPSEVEFKLESICEEDDATKDVFKPARDLADYLTAIATTPGWSTTTNSQLKALYLAFIHSDANGSGIMAGSATNVNAYVTELKNQLVEIKKAVSGDDETLCTAIIDKIDENGCLTNGYPGSIGLPDGAAAVRWMKVGNEYKFMVRTQSTTLDNVNGVNRYAYPPELWYYANSPIRTSADDVAKSKYTGTWKYILDNNYQSGTSVNGFTRSVAVEQSMQYGLGRFQVVIDDIPNSLKDAKGTTVNNTSGLPMTGIIIGEQNTVGFDFTPKDALHTRFIYDSQVGVKGTNTLVMQTFDGEKVPVVIEFQNNIVDEEDKGIAFTGKDGIVYPGCKFYLVAILNPANKGTGAYAGRVFTQDYTTKATMKITSLANAYSCMPDLLEPRLEIGIQVVTDWIQSTTTTVKLE